MIKSKQRPTLCICRGLQIANMALGGSLIEDIPDVLLQDIHRAADKGWTVQPLKADPESLLAETMGASDVATFSGHHQAIKDLGEGLQVTGIAPDGIIEAVELPDLPLVYRSAEASGDYGG